MAKNAVWRTCVFNSTFKAHLVTWSMWLLTAVYFASTVNVRPRSTWYVVAMPAVVGAVTFIVFQQHTCRGTGMTQQDFSFWELPSYVIFLLLRIYLSLKG